VRDCQPLGDSVIPFPRPTLESSREWLLSWQEWFPLLIRGELEAADRWQSLAALRLSVLGDNWPEKLLPIAVQQLRETSQWRQNGLRGIHPEVTPLFDCCGSGGSGLPRFNTSTTLALQLGQNGVPVIKFGNRSQSGRSGSMDFLESLGIQTPDTEVAAYRQFQEQGYLFLNAATVYPSLGRLRPLRQALGEPTLFNVIGPLLNPFWPSHRLLGLAYAKAVEPVARFLAREPYTRNALVFSTHSGLDELEPEVTAQGYWMTQGQCQPWTYGPFEGNPPCSKDEPSPWTDGLVATNVTLFQNYQQGLLPEGHPLLALLEINHRAAQQILSGECPLGS
jgi:anthranilate phosphoribosyltransferase